MRNIPCCNNSDAGRRLTALLASGRARGGVLRLPALALALLLVAASGPAPARADLIYVLNSGDASISVLDSTALEEVRRIPVLREAHHLLLTPDRTRLVIGDSGGNELVFVDPETIEVTRRDRFSNPYHMEYSPDGRLLVVTSLRRNQVDIYDAQGGSPESPHALTLLARLKVPDKPSHLAFSPDSRFAYVTLQGARRIMAIDLAERRSAWTAEVGPQPAGILWHRGRLLIGLMGADRIAVVDPADGRVERTIVVGRGAHTVFAAPDGGALYATSRVDSRISVLDPETLAVTGRIEIAGGPDCIAFDPAGRLWVTLRWIGRVAVLDPRSLEVETIAVGRSPHGIFVQPRRLPMPSLLQAAGAPSVAATPPASDSAVVPAMRAATGPAPDEPARASGQGASSQGVDLVRMAEADPTASPVAAMLVGAEPAHSGQLAAAGGTTTVLPADPVAAPAGASLPPRDDRPFWRRLLGR